MEVALFRVVAGMRDDDAVQVFLGQAGHLHRIEHDLDATRRQYRRNAFGLLRFPL